MQANSRALWGIFAGGALLFLGVILWRGRSEPITAVGNNDANGEVDSGGWETIEVVGTDNDGIQYGVQEFVQNDATGTVSRPFRAVKSAGGGGSWMIDGVAYVDPSWSQEGREYASGRVALQGQFKTKAEAVQRATENYERAIAERETAAPESNQQTDTSTQSDAAQVIADQGLENVVIVDQTSPYDMVDAYGFTVQQQQIYDPYGQTM